MKFRQIQSNLLILQFQFQKNFFTTANSNISDVTIEPSKISTHTLSCLNNQNTNYLRVNQNIEGLLSRGLTYNPTGNAIDCSINIIANSNGVISYNETFDFFVNNALYQITGCDTMIIEITNNDQNNSMGINQTLMNHINLSYSDSIYIEYINYKPSLKLLASSGMTTFVYSCTGMHLFSVTPDDTLLVNNLLTKKGNQFYYHATSSYKINLLKTSGLSGSLTVFTSSNIVDFSKSWFAPKQISAMIGGSGVVNYNQMAGNITYEHSHLFSVTSGTSLPKFTYYYIDSYDYKTFRNSLNCNIDIPNSIITNKTKILTQNSFFERELLPKSNPHGQGYFGIVALLNPTGLDTESTKGTDSQLKIIFAYDEVTIVNEDALIGLVDMYNNSHAIQATFTIAQAFFWALSCICLLHKLYGFNRAISELGFSNV